MPTFGLVHFNRSQKRGGVDCLPKSATWGYGYQCS